MLFLNNRSSRLCLSRPLLNSVILAAVCLPCLDLRAFKHSLHTLLRMGLHLEADNRFQQHTFWFAGELLACVQTVTSVSTHNIEGVPAVLAPNTCQGMLSKPSVGHQSLSKSSTHKLEMLSALTRSQTCSWRCDSSCVSFQQSHIDCHIPESCTRKCQVNTAPNKMYLHMHSCPSAHVSILTCLVCRRKFK